MINKKNFFAFMKKLILIIALLFTLKLYCQSKDSSMTQKIPKRELKSLLNGPKTIYLEEVFNKYHIDAYQLADGRIVTDFSTHGFLYKSRADLINYLDDIFIRFKTTEGKHYLQDYPEFNSSFSLNAKVYSDCISNRVAIKSSLYSFESVKEIDRYFQNSNTNIQLNGELFAVLVAYIGETIIQNNKNAMWQLNRVSDTVFEPVIVIKNRIYNPTFLVYKELFEEFPENGETSLYDHLMIELADTSKRN